MLSYNLKYVEGRSFIRGFVGFFIWAGFLCSIGSHATVDSHNLEVVDNLSI